MPTSFRLAAYAVCNEDGRVLLARHVSNSWTLPGGKVESGATSAPAADLSSSCLRNDSTSAGCVLTRYFS